MRFLPSSRKEWKRLMVHLAIIVGALAAIVAVFYMICVAMPGRSFRGPLPVQTDAAQALELRLMGHVRTLAETIGERNQCAYAGLNAARDHIAKVFREAGCEPRLQTFTAAGTEFANIVAEIPGREPGLPAIVVGAHYDTAPGTPGADDNATGVAALLEIAHALKGAALRHIVRCVAFPNEEPPFFYTEDMGSYRYARACREQNEVLAGVYILESLGYYTDAPGSQTYPVKFLSYFYPDKGNYIAFVGNLASRGLTRATTGAFRRLAQFPSEGIASPEWVRGISFSDHWSFWQNGYQAIMITDIPILRNPHYHTAGDTPAIIDPDRFARVTEGIIAVIRAAAEQE
ncbi:MAG: M28 family peptidase [Planctomycetota bacterium]